MKIIYKLPRILKDESGKIVKRLGLERYNTKQGDLKLKVGSLKEEELKEGLIEKGNEKYACFNAQKIDVINNFKRKAQVITAKDAGLIIAETGINKESKVLESGTGSASLTSFLCNIAKKVVTVEINEDHLKFAKKNLKELDYKPEIIIGNISNVELKENFDVVILDVQNPFEAFENVIKHINNGGFLVLYLPNISQVQEAISKLPVNVLQEKTFEVIQRDWKVNEKLARPETKDFGHTAFITIIRKLY